MIDVLVKIRLNELELQSLYLLTEAVRGAHFVNISIRKDGEFRTREADWLNGRFEIMEILTPLSLPERHDLDKVIAEIETRRVERLNKRLENKLFTIKAPLDTLAPERENPS